MPSVPTKNLQSHPSYSWDFNSKEAVDGNIPECVLWHQIAWVHVPALHLLSNVISRVNLAPVSLSFLICDTHEINSKYLHKFSIK